MNNKKIRIGICILIIVLLFIPFPFNSKSSKTIEYKAVFYSVCNYQEIDNDKYVTGKVVKILGFSVLDSTKEFDLNEFSIVYSYGGGFGTYEGTATRLISINQDGDVCISLGKNYDIDYKKMKYNIGKKKARKLIINLLDNDILNLDSDISLDDVTDMDSSYITINSSNYSFETGGYAASLNDTFRSYSKKIIKVVGQDKINEFNDSIANNE